MNLRTLMTSEFNEGFTPDELKDLLFQFREKYRELESKNDQLERSLRKKDQKIEDLKEDVEKIGKKNKILNNHIQRFNKKLTFKERFTGKIKI